MFKLSRDNKYLVLGLGKTGLAVLDFLIENNYHVGFSDYKLKDLPEKYAKLPHVFGEISLDFLLKFDIIVISPGISIYEKALQEYLATGRKIISEIELFSSVLQERITKNHTGVPKPKVVAITGTNGKTTVSTMLYQIARYNGVDALLLGNIGTAAISSLTHQSALKELYILEVSSFQLESTNSFVADLAVVLNIEPDHLDRHMSFAQYKAEKIKLYSFAKQKIFSKNNTFSLHDSNEATFAVVNNNIIHKGKVCLSENELKIIGKHNLLNSAASLSLSTALGLAFDKSCGTLKNFVGIEHRAELVLARKNVTWINDSKATNLAATLAALDGLANGEKNIILIAGGIAKEKDFTALSKYRKELKQLILFGRDRTIIAENISDILPIKLEENLTQACKIAYNNAQKADIVLFSPACASFDLFANFIDRGNHFKQIVKELYKI